jgi:serine/threonine-protein kinase
MSRSHIHSNEFAGQRKDKCPQCGRTFGCHSLNDYYLSKPYCEGGSTAALRAGERLLDRFTIESCLGRGRLSTVYLASDTMRSTKVALKVVTVTSETIANQFKREIDLYSRVVDHSHVIRVYDIHSAAYAGTVLLLVSMEYADGGSFRQWLMAYKDDIHGRQSEGVSLFRQICQGVKALHDVGIAHLDLKPENLLSVRGVMKVSDLDLSRCVHNIQVSSHSYSQNDSDCLRGTPTYMSPEQFMAPHPDDVDHISDVYSLGVILFETCHTKCRTPFGGSYPQLRERHLHMSAPALEHVGVNIARVVSRCLQKNPADRYRSVSELVEDLEGRLSTQDCHNLEDSTKGCSSEQVRELWEQACQLVETGNLNGVGRLCNQILGISPEHDDAKCMIEEIQNRYQKAQQFYKTIERGIGCRSLDELSALLWEAVGVYPNHPDGHLVQTQLLSVARQYRNAMCEGITAIGSGCWQEALAYFERARQLNPGLPAIAHVIDFVSQVIRHTDTARANIDAALEQRNRRKALSLARGLDEYVEEIRGLVS